MSRYLQVSACCAKRGSQFTWMLGAGGRNGGPKVARGTGGTAALVMQSALPHAVPILSIHAAFRMFSHTIHTTIVIRAPPARVWQLLVADGMGAGSWNPFITRLEGELREGAVLSATAAVPGYHDYKFCPTITCRERCGACGRCGGSLQLAAIDLLACNVPTVRCLVTSSSSYGFPVHACPATQ